MIAWLVTAGNFSIFSYFAPRYENVRRNTFEQSQAYNQGMTQEVLDFQRQYITATPSQKEALADVILHKTASYDLSKLPASSRQFIEKLRRGEK